ncbi:MAG: altronate dehydratase family protein [Armatimonadetes bacterium]|nr:altronate dehydratase family protein [Armatimonadota bacterium]
MARALLLNERDNVAVALEDLAPGAAVAGPSGVVEVVERIATAHKVALTAIGLGEPVTKYGHPIGVASRPIQAGAWVHTHNLAFAPSVRPSASRPAPPAARLVLGLPTTFLGFRREGRRPGIRNAVAVVAASNCAADVVRGIVARLRQQGLPGVEQVAPIVHGSGCGMQCDGVDHAALRRCLNGMILHPNVTAALVVGLGCEVNQLCGIMSGLDGRARVASLGIQDAGGVARAVERGVELLTRAAAPAADERREPLPVAELTVGANCGGSDANSGITANPALGLAGDALVAAGARWVLAETTETFGAEAILAVGAANPEAGRKLLAAVRWWERHTAAAGITVDGNPAPGNKAGGLTTITEKALGAVLKAGSSPLQGACDYAEPITAPGLTFMDTPGHDAPSVTGLAAGGCSLVVFTTGRGSCIGFPAVPILKIGTNSAISRRLSGDIDLDAGGILNGVPMVDVAAAIAQRIIEVASGERTKAELQGLGDDAFVPWLPGPVL